MLDAEAGELCRVQRYERSPDRIDTRAGHYQRKLHTKAGEVEANVPKLRRQPLETATIERYRRRIFRLKKPLCRCIWPGYRCGG